MAVQNTTTIPPHDISGKKIENYLMAGPGAEVMLDLIHLVEKSYVIIPLTSSVRLWFK